jgi:PmbA protein
MTPAVPSPTPSLSAAKVIPSSVQLEELCDLALSEARNLGCTDVSVIGVKSDDSQVRFSNNSISLVNNVRNFTLEIYVSRDRKRVVGATYNPSEEGIKKFLRNLLASCHALPESESYTPLPSGPFRYHGTANFDPKVQDANIVEYVNTAIDQALNSGAKRVSGSLNTESSDIVIRTSAGASGLDRQSGLFLNVRAFADDNASGHGLACSSYISDFDPAAAGQRAGELARRSLNPGQIPEGIYNVVFSPTVVANILPIAQEASAFSIESGTSILADKFEERVAIQTVSIDDYGVYQRGIGGRIFDDEGTPTTQTSIIQDGVFRNMLHNSTTANKFGSKTTGNAGIIAPHPFTIVYQKGTMALNDIIRETKNGIYVTNNWYTRYQNYRTGEYSTVPRDAAFLIQDGEINSPIAGFRISDSIPRQLSNIEMMSKDREWIKWWEVETPTLAPAMMISGVRITRAVGS